MCYNPEIVDSNNIIYVESFVNIFANKSRSERMAVVDLLKNL